MRFLVIAGCVAAFLLSNSVLDLLGWRVTAEDVPGFIKIHPLTYVFAATAVLVAFGPWENRLFSLPKAFFFYAAAAFTALFATLLSQFAGRSPGGEQSGAIVSFITPVFVILSLMALTEGDKSVLAKGLRLFFVVNSVAAMGEFLFRARLLSEYLDMGGAQWRSSALLGHPLLNALLTGMLILYLATAANRRRPFISSVPELLLHGAAMFTFGGRAAMVAVPLLIAYHAVFGVRRGQATTTAPFIRRAAPILIGGFLVALSALPFEFVQSGLARFTNDSGSADTRLDALRMIGRVDTQTLLLGADATQRKLLMYLYDSPLGIEIAWVALTLTYGLIVTSFLAIGLVWLLLNLTRRIDPSGRTVAIYFLVVTAASLSLGVKSLLISQTLIMLYAFSGGLPARHGRKRRSLVQLVRHGVLPRRPVPARSSGPAPARPASTAPASAFFGLPLRKARRSRPEKRRRLPAS